MWMEVHIYIVKAKSEPGKIWVKDIMVAVGIVKICVFCRKIQQETALLGLDIYLWEYTWKVAASPP